ncbi:MAG: hypothetical protein H6712_25620 [Myxococcales bacterium]|nr:hypothetical protein [Myxococcales bacterium]MCB9717254.1 hypothetical protein [Myxococcales bacterium]
MRRALAALTLLSVAACGRSPVGWRDDGADGLGGRGDGDDSSQTCQQADFLFVIDDSESMADNQEKLAANYDIFVGGIVDAVERLETIHVGVVTTDAYVHNGPGCQDLGGLVVRTGGPHSSSHRCGPYAEGHNYMTEADDLDESFRCAARVGTAGSAVEAVLGASVAALSPPLTEAGGCNEGFLRDDALLVLVIVTDEDAEVDPVFAASELLSRKDGGLDDVVVVALGNPSDGSCGLGDTQVSLGLEAFVRSFRHGFMGPICASSYEEVFAEAVALVEDACPAGR